MSAGDGIDGQDREEPMRPSVPDSEQIPQATHQGSQALFVLA